MSLSKGDLDRLLDLLSTPEKLESALDEADKVLRDAYWQDKNLGIVAWLGQVILPLAYRPVSTEAKSKIKTISYNVASFLWPGWDEPGVIISKDQQDLGAQAAELNLRLADELDKPVIAKSRAHWMMGGYLLTQREFGRAAQSFATAARLAGDDGNRAEQLLSEAFRDLATNSPELKSRLAELRTLKDGEAFAGQVLAAARVCGFQPDLG